MLAINNLPRSSKTGKGGTGILTKWQTMFCLQAGPPHYQNRERVFIIGHLGGFGGRQVFPIGTSNGKDIVQLNSPKHSNNRLYGEDGVSPTLNTAQGGNRQPKVMRQPLKFLDRNQKNIEGDYAFTVDSMNTGGVKVDTKIRRLTPTECERLMGLPDGWTEGVSDTQRYKLCGNGVVVNVVEEIIKRLCADHVVEL